MNTSLLSRPEEQLTRHCRAVAERSDEPAGWVHDLPKATQWFQRYVASGIDATRTDLALKDHARLAGYVAFYCARQRGVTPQVAYTDAIAVAKHHGNVPDASSYIESSFPGIERWIDVVRRELNQLDLSRSSAIPGNYNAKALAQARDIAADAERRRVADYLVRQASDGAGSWNEFYESFEAGDLQATMRAAITNPVAPAVSDDVFADGGEWYEDLLRVYAAIQFADATAAGSASANALSAPQFPVGMIDDRVQAIRSNAAAAATDDLTDALNGIRSAVQDDLVDRLRNGVADELQGGGVARLSLPTGYGKTLSAGLFAERLFDYGTTRDRRVLYALPFTTVADQTAAVFERALARRAGGDEDQDGDETESVTLGEKQGTTGTDATDTEQPARDELDPMVLSIDHHRAPTPTDRVADQQNVTKRGAETILSAWRPRMTITTVVQLFESVVGPFRSQSRKLPALNGAIIVIDEPQAIPIGWRPLVARAVETLVERDNAIVLLMTATQPFLLGGGREAAASEASSDGKAGAGSNNNRDGNSGSVTPASDIDIDVVDLVPADALASIEAAACDEAGLETVPNRVIYEFHESVLSVTNGDGGKDNEEEGQSESEDGSDSDNEGDHGPKDGSAPLLSHAAAGDRIGATFTADREPTLAICNTVSSTRQLTDALETALREAGIDPLSMGRGYDEAIDRDSQETSFDALTAEDLLETIETPANTGAEETGGTRVPVFHLTRRLPSAKLSTLIEAAATLAERGTPHLVVSTQLVEAGVDISYRRVYRDFAPLDSIVQAAGRCNRSYEWGIDGGHVWVWALESAGESDGARSPAEQVYATDRTDVSVAMNTLERSRTALAPLLSRSVLREADLREAVETYHAELSADLAGVTAADDALLAAYEQGDGRTLRHASLIEERFEVDVIVCMTDGDFQLVTDLPGHIDDGDWSAATRVRRRLTRLSVAVPVYSPDSDRWDRLTALDKLIPDHDGDERVIGFDSDLLDARDGIRFD